MEFAPWSTKLNVGVPFVDKDHQELFSLVNQLHESMIGGKGREATRPILVALRQYAANHFEREERMLAGRGYPKLAEHKTIHAAFIERLNQLQDKVDSGSTLVSIDLLKFLKSWLTDHIAMEDQNYATYLKDNGGLGA